VRFEYDLTEFPFWSSIVTIDGGDENCRWMKGLLAKTGQEYDETFAGDDFDVGYQQAFADLFETFPVEWERRMRVRRESLPRHRWGDRWQPA
jgi:hypothetical protein